MNRRWRLQSVRFRRDTNWSRLATSRFDLPPLDQQRRIAETSLGRGSAQNRLLEASSASLQGGLAMLLQMQFANGEWHKKTALGS